MEKGLKLKVRKFWWLIPTFGEVTGEKLVGGPFCPAPILNRVNGTTISTPLFYVLLLFSALSSLLSSVVPVILLLYLNDAEFVIGSAL